MNVRARVVLAVPWFCLLHVPVLADELHVPTPNYPTIQAAIDAGTDGDEVIVAPGTYEGTGNCDIQFEGKAITVRSQDPNDPNIVAATVIKCGPDDPCDPDYGVPAFGFLPPDGPGTVVAGLTIINGHCPDDGGAIQCMGGSPTIYNCTFVGNRSDDDGGAIFGAGDATITGCTFTGNSSQHKGGAICWVGESPTITHCTFTQNSADEGGMAIWCGWPGTPTISYCTVSGNTCTEDSGETGSAAIQLSEGTCAIVTNCTITGNDGGAVGGAGVWCESSSATIANCTISANTGSPGGGGIGCLGGDLTVTNCLVTGHLQGIGCLGGYAMIENCTVAGNDWGLITVLYGTIDLANCIAWGNQNLVDNYGGQIVVTYSDVQGGWPGEGNIEAGPCFVDPNGPDGDPNTWEDNDYHLGAHSRCINAGRPTDPNDPNTDYSGQTDIDGQKRVMNGRVDMGADEKPPCGSGAAPMLPMTLAVLGISAWVRRRG